MIDSAQRARFIERIPKVELHVHLEGAIRPRTLLRLAKRRAVTLPADSEEGLRRYFEFRDFDHFLEVYLLCSSCLRDPEDFQLIVEDFLDEQQRQNVLHSEAYLTISTHIANGVNADEVADALRETLADNDKRGGPSLRLIPDIVRNMPIERADQTLEWAIEHRGDLVAALGIAGKETPSCEAFRAHFREAERVGLPRVAHAGEQTNAGDIWQALEACRPQRIGHGIRAIDDPSLISELRERRMPLEICQTSNVCLGYCPDLESHPLRRLHEEGIALSLNSDDPALFGTTLNREYHHAAELLALDLHQLTDLALQALEQSFLDGRAKTELGGEMRRRLTEELAALGG